MWYRWLKTDSELVRHPDDNVRMNLSTCFTFERKPMELKSSEEEMKDELSALREKYEELRGEFEAFNMKGFKKL